MKEIVYIYAINIIVTSHMWLSSIWNMCSVAEELMFNII